jgi:uncharacterized phage-like protein YoqJ
VRIQDDKERLRIAGTGHRPQKLNPLDLNDKRFGFSQEAHQILLDTARQALTELQDNHPGKEIDVITGVALGFDQALAEAALEKNMHVIAAIPFEGQEKTWRPDSQRRYFELLERITQQGGEVHVISPGGYSAAKMQTRNIWMVDRADKVLALHSGFSGGTANCIEYAKDQGKDIHNIWQTYSEKVRQFIEGRDKPNRPTSDLHSQIDVVHVNTFKGERDESFIYIGRAMPSHSLEASPLANPYRIGPDGTREEVIEKYYGWLRQEFKNLDSPAREELLRIKELVQAGNKISLACWCSPQSCHGEVIRESVVKLIEREKTHGTQTYTAQVTESRERASTTSNERSSSGEPVLVAETTTAVNRGGETSREISTDRPLSNRTAQAHIDILGNNSREELRSLYEVTDGLSRAEHASQLNQTNVEARDAFEHGATIYGDALVIPKEFDSLPRETTITTRQHAFNVISQFVEDESLAKEKADELVELAEQICGRWSDSQSRLTIFQNLYDQITEDEHGRPLPLAEREAALEKTLETSRVWAAEMSALEPREAEEHELDDPFEHEPLQLEADRLHDENEVYAHLFEEAIERGSEQAQEHDHVEVELRGGSALPETAYERINLNDLPPGIPEGISLEEEERLLTETLPAIDKAIESGVSRDEIMRGIYASNAREERDGHGAKVLGLFAAASLVTDRAGGATRAELLQAYTTLRVLVSEELEKELSRISPEVLRQMREYHASTRQSQSQDPPQQSRNVDPGSAVAPTTGIPAAEYYVAHEKEIRVSQQNLLRLDQIPNTNTIEHIETLERALQNIDGAIDRLGATQQERVEALNTVAERAHSVMEAETERLSSYEQAETLRAETERSLQRPLELPTLREQLEDDRTKAIDDIAKVRGDYLTSMGFIPDSSQQAREFVSPYLSGVERTSQIISESRSQLGAGPLSYETEKVGPVHVSLAGRPTVRLPLGSVQEHKALTTLSEACKLPVTSWHGLYGRQIDGRNEEREQVTRFVSNYIDFRLRDSETRLLNQSVEYRVYSNRLDSARTIEELRSTAKEIRRDNYNRSQQIKAHQQDPKSNPLPERLDPSNNARPRALTSYEMRQLFISQAPEHYTDEMREYRQGLSISGRDKDKRVEALARGELTPSKHLSLLLEELDKRKLTPEALGHYTRCLTTPSDKMLRPASFDMHAVHEKLLPYERDYLFNVLSEKRDSLRGRDAREQSHGQTPSKTPDEKTTERSTIKELSKSEVFRSYYAAATWREAELFTTERSRREQGVTQSEKRSTIVQGVPDRNLDAAGYVLHNFDAKQAQDVAAYLCASSNRQMRATGEIIQIFSEIKQDLKHDGSMELSLTVPQQSRHTENEWKALLNHFHPDNRSENNFLRSKLPENQLAEIRRDAQVMAWAEMEPQIRATNYSPDSRAEVLYQALEVKDALNSARELQEGARTAHYALEGHITSCVTDVERKLAEPGRFLSNETALRIASHTAKVGSYAASFAGQREIANGLNWTSARLKESAAAAGHVEAQGGTERTTIDRENTRNLVKAALDPEYAKANAEFVNDHAKEFHFIQQTITPKNEKTYRELKSYAAKAKQKYLNSFLELDKRQQQLSSTKEQDAQQRSQSRSDVQELNLESQSRTDFQREFEAAERQLVGERLEAMVKDGELPERTSVSADQTIRDLLPEKERQAIAELARDSAWWNMVPPEVRGIDYDERTSTEVLDRSLEVSDTVSTARDVEKELIEARAQLASFLTGHTTGEADRQNALQSEERAQDMGMETAHAQVVGQSPEEQRELAEQLLQTLGPDERAALEQLTERVDRAEENMGRAFDELDKSREGLDLAREEQLMEHRMALFNDIRQPMEDRMSAYLGEALRADGIDAFRDQSLVEKHVNGLSEAMYDCVDEHDLKLDDLNLRTEDVQEIARDLISSVSTTLEHGLDHTISRDVFNSTHDFSNSLGQSVQMLDAADSRLGMDHDQASVEINAHEMSERMQEEAAHDLTDGATSRPGAVDKEQTQGVRGMEPVSQDLDRATEHLEHARDAIEIFTH